MPQEARYEIAYSLDDELLAFASEMDNNWVLQSNPTASAASASIISPATRSKKPRHSRRQDFAHAREEINQLQRQCQILQENSQAVGHTRQFGQSLDWIGGCSRRASGYY